MKNIWIFASVGMLAISAIIVVGCSKDDEWEDVYSLDISNRTPITKSAQNDFETGSSQSLNGGTSAYTVPQNENECMLYAIIKIAASRRIPITCIKSDGSSETKIIGNKGFTATAAYDYVKGLATSQSWTPCDINGNPIPDSTPYQYTGGAMTPSVAKEIGQQSGILKGSTMYFNSYKDMLAYMNTPQFKRDHPSGTYIINSHSGGHATIGNGVDRNGNIRYSDSNNSNSKYKDSERIGSWTLIF